jgi:hypothetical protein
MDTNLIIAVSTLGIVFLLVILLGLQIQISILIRRIDEMTSRIEEKLNNP